MIALRQMLCLDQRGQRGGVALEADPWVGDDVGGVRGERALGAVVVMTSNLDLDISVQVKGGSEPR